MDPILHFANARSRWMAALVCVLFFLAFFSSSSVAKDMASPQVVKVGAYDNYPKIFFDTEGGYAGIFPDLLDAVAERQGWKIEYVGGTWSECLSRLESGKIDIMVDVAYTKGRAEKFVFNDENVLLNWGAVYTRADLDVETLTDLQGLRVAVMKGSIHTTGKDGIKSLLKRFNVQPAEYLEEASYKDVFKLLDTGLADAGVVNRIYGVVFENNYNVGKTSIIFNPIELRFAFPKNSKRTRTLKAAIDKELRELKQDDNSVYYRVLDRYLVIGSPGISNLIAKGGNERIVLTEEEEAWVRRHPVVRFAVDPEFVPYEFLGAHGEFGGIASDYVKLVSNRLGVRFERIPNLDWDEAMDAARKGKVDLFPCVGKTDNRLDFLRYSRPYTQYSRVVVTRTDAPFITGLGDIAGLRVAVQQNTSHEGFLLDNTDIRPCEVQEPQGCPEKCFPGGR